MNLKLDKLLWFVVLSVFTLNLVFVQGQTTVYRTTNATWDLNSTMNATEFDPNSTTTLNSSITDESSTIFVVTPKEKKAPQFYIILGFLGLFIILMAILMCVLCTNMSKFI